MLVLCNKVVDDVTRVSVEERHHLLGGFFCLFVFLACVTFSLFVMMAKRSVNRLAGTCVTNDTIH